ncbi:nucleotidyl transferase AbiEii/AbiGii toxin family protein [Candidatus Berkelbacteria bacterium]|nr:nucleotidyl transferase AbiEii/AbiGii toxin family protein [Candidatus Berkelbacteria bacterium]
MLKTIESPIDLLKAVARVFAKHHIPYYVTGGFAVSLWGRPRFTADIDLVVSFGKQAVPLIIQEFKKLSSALYVDEDQMLDALHRKGEFNFVEPNIGLKVDFWVSGNSVLDQTAMRRRKAKFIRGQKVHFISPEDLILSKLLWWSKGKSTRHLEDIESVVATTKKLDSRYLKSWVRRLRLSSTFQTAAGKMIFVRPKE